MAHRSCSYSTSRLDFACQFSAARRTVSCRPGERVRAQPAAGAADQAGDDPGCRRAGLRLDRDRVEGAERPGQTPRGDPGPGGGGGPGTGVRAQRAVPRAAGRADLHRRRDHHRQLRPVQHSGHARRRGCPRGRPDLGVHVRYPRRPGPRAAVPEHAAQPSGGRADRGRAADRAAAQHRAGPGHSGGTRDDPVDGQRRARDPARRHRRGPARRRAPAQPRPAPVRPHRRPGAVPVRPQASPGLLRRGRRGRRRLRRARRAVRRVERAVGPGGGPGGAGQYPAAATRSPAASPTRCG